MIMRMLMVVYDAGFDEEVLETLKKAGIKGYTKWTRVLGDGEKSDPKMDDGIWPGYNHTLLMAVKEEEAPVIQKAVTRIHKFMGEKGIRVYSWPVVQVV
jgi:nitrogen regulatory protein PII